MKNIKHRNPMQTRNGRPKLHGLNVAQLRELFDKSASKRLKGKIRQEIDIRLSKIK